MRVLLAFDKFKDSLTAGEACAITADALRMARPDWSVDACPLADGGEGFAAILTRAAQGELREITVTGPRGAPVPARFGLVDTRQVPAAVATLIPALAARRARTVGVIEMAAASGLELLSAAERDVWETTTTGTGELMQAATRAGADTLVLGVGGSATSDLGVGALQALGLQFHTVSGTPASRLAPSAWTEIARVAGRLSLPPVYIACDVTNPLLGPNGAAAVYGPQKGLRAADISRLDHAAARMAMMLCSHFRRPDSVMETPGAGAAGGIAFGLMVAADAELLPGFDFVARWLDLDARVAAADLVITGEGRFDDSSLSGKGPGAVAARALALGKRVHVFAGAVTATTATPRLQLHPITPPGTALPRALADAPRNLQRAVGETFRAG